MGAGSDRCREFAVEPLGRDRCQDFGSRQDGMGTGDYPALAER